MPVTMPAMTVSQNALVVNDFLCICPPVRFN
jgi:hypothetical protein